MKDFFRQVLGFFLLAVLLVKMCLIPVIYLDFELRRDYIIATLCENRTRPKLQCNGKCYLAKRLAEARKQEERQAEQNFLTKLFAPAIPVSPLFTSDLFDSSAEDIILSSVLFAYSGLGTSSDVDQGIFHPPLC